MNFIIRIEYLSENYIYCSMYKKLDYFYANGLFDEARQLIDSIETNSVTIRMFMDLRLKETDYYYSSGKF